MDGNEIKVTCPECNCEIDVDNILAHQIEDRIRRDYNKKFAEKLKESEELKLQIEQEKEKLNREKNELEKTIEDTVNQKLKSQEIQLREKLKKEIVQEQSIQLKSLEDELNEKSEQLKDYHKQKAEISKLLREKDELKDKIEAEAELRLNNLLAAEKEKIQKSESEKNLLKISEKEKIIEQLKTQLTEAQRKAEQGSQQLQGEVQELAIEEFLTKAFPLDKIEEIKKGKRGADCLQTINTEYSQNCGSIYYESKRSKNFQNSWIDKLKDDMRSMKASVGVLVTETMPSGMDFMGQIDGIWVCTLNEFKSLSYVLRESIVKVSDALVSQDNRGDKMSMMYDYLTSDEFKNHVKDIAEAFVDMQDDLESEKRAMEGLWRKREKQNQKVLNNLNFMFNSIKGIAGNSIGSINALELPYFDDMDDDDEESDKEQGRLL